MPRRNNRLLDALFRIPWWVSVLLAATIYISLKHFIPAIQTENAILLKLAEFGPYFAPFAALIFLLPAPFSMFKEDEEEKEDREE